MADIAIQVEGLGKQYRIGRVQAQYQTLRDTMMDTFAAPIRHVQRMWRRGADEPNPEETIWAVQDVAFEINQGEIVGLIGRNGAGKSTLLKILSRITEPTRGWAEIRGRVSSLLEVGTGFHPELTGRENLYLNGAILGMKRGEIDRKFDEIVDFAGVERFIDTPVKRYSSGMYLRLAFAVSAHLEPEVLLVDEVLAVGDQDFQRRCLGRMRTVADSGRTVIFISHNMAAVSHLCTRGLLLHEGCLVEDGPVADVIAHYNQACTTFAGDRFDFTALSLPERGGLRVTSLRVLDANGQSVNRITLGQPVEFEIAFECRETLHSPGFGIVFFTADGRRVLRVMTAEMNDSMPPCHEGGKVVCRIDKLMLTPGPYVLTIGTRNGYEQLDRLEQCAEISVEAADIYGTGRLPTQAFSSFVAQGEWACQYE